MTDPTHSGLNPIEHSTLSSHSASSLSPSTSIMVSLNRTHYNPRNSRSSSDRRPPGTLSSTTKDTKLEHIIQNFYTKTAQMIIQSRVSSDKLRRSVNKLNRWFNISTGDCEQLKEQLNFWKSLVYRQRDEPMPPLIIDIYMDDTPELCKEGSCVYGWTDSSIQANKHKKIILESWILTLNHPMPDASFDLPSLYKKAILFFRTLHSLIRLLPSHELYRRMKEYDDASLGYILSTHMNHRAQSVFQSDTIANNIFKDYEFTEVPTPLGIVLLSLNYLIENKCTLQ
ncbi:autophagy-related protein 13-domain-containing protein [Pilobolus umbonatus]|nr:autophagy-related protein 13-domain-containing protein [Pilobolus umbonatus]